MSEENTNGKDLTEIREMLKVIIEEQKQILEGINELKAEQKKIQEEVRMNNFVLNTITLRNEIIN